MWCYRWGRWSFRDLESAARRVVDRVYRSELRVRRGTAKDGRRKLLLGVGIGANGSLGSLNPPSILGELDQTKYFGKVIVGFVGVAGFFAVLFPVTNPDHMFNQDHLNVEGGEAFGPVLESACFG